MLMRLVALLTTAILAAPTSQAGEAQALRGLFCNTRLQLDEALNRLDEVGRLSTAVALANDKQIVCTFASSIRYVVHSPVVIGRRVQAGEVVKMYEASLVGVLVGDNPRPVEPPLQIFFISFDPVPGATFERRT